MATIKPFAALRPAPELASRICELPYDVMSTGEAREMAAGNPLSFLHVSKPEIDLPPGTDPYSDAVYAAGRANFERLAQDGSLREDSEPGFYLYRQVMGSHSQTGIVAVASCEEYIEGTIKKHEFTRPDKEDDRVRHIEALGAQTGPVFLTYRADPDLDRLVADRTAGAPEVDFVASDGVRHSAWSIQDSEGKERVGSRFARIPALYIADGHHRSAAAARVYQSSRGAGGSAWFLAVIFPHSQVRILPYNRVLKDLNGQSAGQLLERLGEVFDVGNEERAVPGGRHEVSIFIEGRWRGLRFRPELTASGDPAGLLDVTLLQEHVLSPLFGIEDPRTSRRINFIGGIRGTAELERLVIGGEYACAFSMHPTGIEDLMAISDRGGIMPPKSTWFEPKLRDGLFSHRI